MRSEIIARGLARSLKLVSKQAYVMQDAHYLKGMQREVNFFFYKPTLITEALRELYNYLPKKTGAHTKSSFTLKQFSDFSTFIK